MAETVAEADNVARLTASNSQILNLKRSHTERTEQYKTCKTKKEKTPCPLGNPFAPPLPTPLLLQSVATLRYNGASFMFTKRLCSAQHKRASAPTGAPTLTPTPTGTGTVAGVLIKQFVEFRVNCEKTTRTCSANLATDDTVQL